MKKTYVGLMSLLVTFVLACTCGAAVAEDYTVIGNYSVGDSIVNYGVSIEILDIDSDTVYFSLDGTERSVALFGSFTVGPYEGDGYYMSYIMVHAEDIVCDYIGDNSSECLAVLKVKYGGVSDLYSFDLHEGENMISFPVMPVDTSVASVFAPVSDKLSIVWAYDASDVSDPWKKYDPAVPFGNDLVNIEAGMGYIVTMSEAAELDVIGDLVSLDAADIEGSLVVGNNFVGPGAESVVLENYVGRWRYDANDNYTEYSTLASGLGYWVIVEEELPGESYTFNLHEGENMISFPVMPVDTSVASVFAPISDKLSIVWAYDASDVSDPWKKYDPAVPFGNDLVNIEAGMGYIVTMSAAAELDVVGEPVALDASDIAGSLVDGYNLVGPGSESVVLENYVGRWRYDANDNYTEYSTLASGRGYWVIVEEDADDVDPVILSVDLFPAVTVPGHEVRVSVEASDDSGSVTVTADGNPLTYVDGKWVGSIIAPAVYGDYQMVIAASDEAGNTVETSSDYSVVSLIGTQDVGISPRAMYASGGDVVTVGVTVKNRLNIDDVIDVRINVDNLPAYYAADLSWFSWVHESVELRAGEERTFDLTAELPLGVYGYKLFRANIDSESTSVYGMDTGYFILK